MRKARRQQARRSPVALRLIRYPARSRPGEAAAATDGSLALAARPSASASASASESASHGPPARADPGSRPGPLLGPPPDPGLTASARTIIQLVIDVLAGHRPPHQLAWRASAQVRDGLAGLRPPDRARRRTVPPRVIRFWVQHPAPDRAEAGAVAVVGHRVHAVAVRLERHRDQWRCAAVETTAAPD